MFCRPAALIVAAFLFTVAMTGGGRPAQAAGAPSRAQLATGVTFDPHGRLWRAYGLNGRLVVDVSADRGTSFSPPVAVTPTPEPIAAHGEARPEVAVAANGDVYVAWTTPLPTNHAGHVRFARSLDGGKTFGAPLTVNDDRQAITHSFQTLHVAADGRITLVWIDKREGVAAKQAGQDYRGAALYYAVSTDRGASFQANARLAAHSCECCRIALADAGDGPPLALWRHVFADGTRDHALARVATQTADVEPLRASQERWQINACPHHGPDLAVAADGIRHGAWFNQSGGEPGLFYSAWNRDGTARGAAMRFGGAGAAHPALLALGSRLLLVWKAFDGESTVVSLIESHDQGQSWSAPRAVATAADASDHPRLVAYGNAAFLSWAALVEGYRLIPLDAGPTQ